MNADAKLMSDVKRLTRKQREALDLLINHKTSKEISRELGVSPHTVDQRIDGAKRIFDVSTRGELALAYRSSLNFTNQPVYERMTYESSGIDPGAGVIEQSRSVEADTDFGPKHPNRTESFVTEQRPKDYRVGPGFLHGPQAIVYRLLAIALIAVLLVIALLGGISIYVAVSQIISN